jgi:hypothetical protein
MFNLKEIADAIGLTGKTRTLGMSTIGTPNLVQQAFKATVNFHDSEGKEIGKVRVDVVSDFVDVRAVDWSVHSSGEVSAFGVNQFSQTLHWWEMPHSSRHDNHHK